MPSITFFPVDNGDMTLVTLESGRRILIDVNIRDVTDEVRDVAKDLRDLLKVDAQGRPYVDAFLLSHPDQDHIRGLKANFHLGALNTYKEPPKGQPKKIVIREMWSSPMVFRRASKNHTLCEDAEAWNTEVHRRLDLFKAGQGLGDGDRVLIMGEDENGKTDNLQAILIKVDTSFSTVNGSSDNSVSVRLLAPRPKGSDDEEALRSKNHSSVITQFSIRAGSVSDACLFLTGGDAEVAIWEAQWAKHKADPQWLRYDILQTPHHCSWHSLSHDSWSELGEKAKVSKDARSALSQARAGGFIVASSKVITDDDSDPPCIRAEREYKQIAADVSGTFKNTAIHPTKVNPEPMEFEIKSEGVRLKDKKAAASAAVAGVGTTPVRHGLR